jgi:fatty acid desaturase
MTDADADAVAAPKTPMSHADYVRALRLVLPPEAFRPNPYALIPIAIHLAIVVAGWIALRNVTDGLWWPLIGLVIGNSYAALAFYAHDVSHRSVVTHRYLLYPTEFITWSLLYLPPTLWRRVHGTHHAHTNSEKDPDRRFLPSELTPTGTVFAATMFPNRVLRFNLTHWFYWVMFPFRHAIVALFYHDHHKTPHFVTARTRFSRQEKIWLVAEIAAILLLHFAIYKFVHGPAYLWAVFVPTCIASAVVSWYFFTNHGLKPVGDGNDILASTTTVMVPEVCNRLHSNFAYHTEHHLFPNMNPKFYPLVSQHFRTYFPDRYHCIPITVAWSELMKNSIAAVRRGERPEDKSARDEKPIETGTARPA